MTDRELLELAAKAAGLEFEWNAGLGAIEYIPKGCRGYIKWLPLDDDGAALRLLVTIGAGLNTSHPETLCFSSKADVSEPHGPDKFAATRRAIVRSAAAIGAATKGQQ